MNKSIRIENIKPATIWISGLTASGKTTYGRLLYKDLKDFGLRNVKFLDGEDLRKRLTKNYGHSLNDRYILINKWIDIVMDENKKGFIVIISTVSHRKKMRSLARKKIDRFMEINIKCSPTVCAERDYKNIYHDYENNINGFLPGVTEPYEFTSGAELILDTENYSIKHCRKILFDRSVKFLNNIF